MDSHNYKIGDPVVFRTTKYTARPGPRAEDIHPAPRGDNYTYHVDKFWVVAEVHNDGTLVVQTRRGKRHVIQADNPQLRHATRWERLRYAGRFPQIETLTTAN